MDHFIPRIAEYHPKMSSYSIFPHYFKEELNYFDNFIKKSNDEISIIHQSILQERLSLLDSQLEDPDLDVNIRNQNYEPPLLAALRIKDPNVSLQIIQRLLKRHVDINFGDYHNETPLHEAVKKESSYITNQIVDLIINHPNCNVNARNYFGETPLHVTKSVYAAKKLIEKGANIQQKDNSSNTPLHSQVQRYQICEVLLQNRAVINATNTNGFAPLHEATFHNQLETVKLLLAYGANPNLENDNQRRMTPLHISFRCKSNPLIKELLWPITNQKYLLFAVTYDSTTITKVQNDWFSRDRNEDELTNFILEMINLMISAKDLKMWTCGKLVAQYFLDNLSSISEINIKRILQRFSDYFKLSLLTFMLKTHDYSKDNSHKEIEVIVKRLLQLGVTIEYSDLEVTYLHFGNSSFLHDLLKVSVYPKTRKLKDLTFFLKVLCDPTLNLTELMKTKHISSIDMLDFFDIHNISRFCTLSKKLYIYFFEAYSTMIKYSKPDLYNKLEKNNLKKIGDKCGVPKLLELARNEVRPTLCKKFQITTTSELYKILNKTKLPPLIISIIMLEMPIYFDIRAPDYIPCTRHHYLL